MTKACFCKQQSSSQMRETLTTDIFQFSALEQVPHPLLRIGGHNIFHLHFPRLAQKAFCAEDEKEAWSVRVCPGNAGKSAPVSRFPKQTFALSFRSGANVP